MHCCEVLDRPETYKSAIIAWLSDLREKG